MNTLLKTIIRISLTIVLLVFMWLENKFALYFILMRIWAEASCDKYTQHSPNEITWQMVSKYLENRIWEKK